MSSHLYRRNRPVMYEVDFRRQQRLTKARDKAETKAVQKAARKRARQQRKRKT